MKLFSKKINCFQPLIIFVKKIHNNVWKGPKYAPERKNFATYFWYVQCLLDVIFLKTEYVVLNQCSK